MLLKVLFLLMLIESATAHIEMEVRAAAWTTTSTAATATASATSEEVSKDVIEIHVMELLAASLMPMTSFMLTDAFFSLLIINAPFLFV